MFIHIFILLLVCIAGAYFYWTPLKRKKNVNLYFIIATLFPIWLVQTLRGESVGIDTQSYVDSFRRINEKGQSWEELNWEKGYVLINKIVWKFFGDNYHVLLGCVSLIILCGIGYFILKNTEKTEAFWAVFFFVTLNHYFTSMVSLRQYCALAIGINMFTVLNRERCSKDYIKAIVLIVISVMFHSSAIVLGLILLSYLLGGLNKRRLILIVCICTLVYRSYDRILHFIVLFLGKYSLYIYGNHVLSGGTDFAKGYIVLLIGKIALISLVLCLKDENKKNNILYELTFLIGMGAVFSILTIKMAIFFRFTYYFDIYLIIYIPKVLNRLSDVKVKKITFIGCYCLAIVYFVYLLYTNCARCVPYVLGV